MIGWYRFLSPLLYRYPKVKVELDTSMGLLQKFCLIFLSLILVFQFTAAGEAMKESSVSYVDGAEPDMDSIYIDIERQDSYVQRVMLRTEHTTEIDVESEGPEDYRETGRDLVAAGADSSTTFEIEILFEDYTPRFIAGNADQMDWERENTAMMELSRPLLKQIR